MAAVLYGEGCWVLQQWQKRREVRRFRFIDGESINKGVCIGHEFDWYDLRLYYHVWFDVATIFFNFGNGFKPYGLFFS